MAWKATMKRLLLLLGIIWVSPASALLSEGGIDWVAIYGASRWDGCDACAAMQDTGWPILEIATNGTVVYDLSNGGCDGAEYPSSDPSCDYGAGKSVRNAGSAPFDECWFQADLGSGTEPTCMADLMENHGPRGVVVIQYGTNAPRYDWDYDCGATPLSSCGAGEFSDDFRESFIRPAWDKILNRIDTLGLGCVVIKPPPYYMGAGFSNTPEYDEDLDPWNVELAEMALAVAEIEAELAQHSQCVYVDLDQMFADYESDHGSAAFAELFVNCEASELRDGVSQLNGGVDCMHYNETPNSLGDTLGDLIGVRVRGAVHKAREIIRDQ